MANGPHEEGLKRIEEGAVLTHSKEAALNTCPKDRCDRVPHLSPSGCQQWRVVPSMAELSLLSLLKHTKEMPLGLLEPQVSLHLQPGLLPAHASPCVFRAPEFLQ